MTLDKEITSFLQRYYTIKDGSFYDNTFKRILYGDEILDYIMKVLALQDKKLCINTIKKWASVYLTSEEIEDNWLTLRNLIPINERYNLIFPKEIRFKRNYQGEIKFPIVGEIRTILMGGENLPTRKVYDDIELTIYISLQDIDKQLKMLFNKYFDLTLDYLSRDKKVIRQSFFDGCYLKGYKQEFSEYYPYNKSNFTIGVSNITHNF